MGIDIHIGGHYFPLSHIHGPVLFLLAPIALYLAFKLGRYVLMAMGILSN
jgi:hypothetical protein